MTVPMITVLVRSSNERLISSMPNTIPASGVLKAAATPAAEPASMNPGWRCGANPAQRKHDRGADLHGRAFAPARGAAEKSEGQENNLAERDAQRHERAAERVVRAATRRNHLRNPAALRAFEDVARQHRAERKSERGN